MHADWEIWTAGTVTSSGGRDQFIRAVRNYAASGKNSAPFGDLYQTTDGKLVAISGHARPVVGGHLALVRGRCSFFDRGWLADPCLF